MDNLVSVENFRSRVEAGMAQSMLEAEGIPTFLSADDAGGYAPYLLLGGGGVSLFVRPADAERARELLDAAEEIASDGGSEDNGPEEEDLT